LGAAGRDDEELVIPSARDPKEAPRTVAQRVHDQSVLAPIKNLAWSRALQESEPYVLIGPVFL
jgi:hypothetical protein